MWVQHCRLVTVKQQKWPCEIYANTSHKRASPAILVLVVRAWSTHILQSKYYWRPHLGLLGLKSNFLKATLLLAPPKKLCITYRSKRCAHFISVQRNTDRKRLQTALFPRDFRTIPKEPRPFFSPTAMSTLLKRCYLCFCAPAIASLLLRTSVHPDRQPESPVTEGTFTRQRILGRWLVGSTPAQHSALSSLDQTGMVRSLSLVKFLKLLCKLKWHCKFYISQNMYFFF